MAKKIKIWHSFWWVFEVCIAILWLVCLNVSAIKEFDQFPSLHTINGRGWQIALSYVILSLVVLFILRREKKLQSAFVNAWLENRWLLLFLAFSTASLIWSVARITTFYEIILLICSTFITSYIALRFHFDGVIDILTWFAVVSTIASLMIVFFVPNIGIMHGAGHFGSWRGLFWHRNHAGIMMAFFNITFLFRILTDPVPKIRDRKIPNIIIFGIFYALTAIHVFWSNSASGKIIFIALNLLLITAWLWMKWRTRIETWHYYAVIIASAVMVLLVASNLGFVFALLNRDKSMTGRTTMWPDLIQNTFLTKPYLGHGFATIWTQESFRVLVQHRWGWDYQPYFSDNGYLDILLNLGAVGLLIFLFGSAFVVKRVLVLFYKPESREAIFFFINLVFVIIANISYSFLFEVEYFTWSLIVLVAVLSVAPSAITSSE